MITVEDLAFTYPGVSKPTLGGLNFQIEKGEIFGFLGPSGAGKSTTQNILIRLLAGYQGTVRIMGKELISWGPEYFENIGVSFELPNHYLKLTALENLSYFRSLYSGKTHNPEDVLEWVGLSDHGHERVARFSKGMKIRLNVARSLIHKPKLLFLDEPTSGLDPVNADKIRRLVLELRSQGTTVFVTTHNMQLADDLCDRVAFINRGEIATIDAPASLKQQHGRRVLRVDYRDGADKRQMREFSLDGLGDNAAFQELIKAPHRIETMHSEEATLDKIFIEVTGNELMA
ncbi:MAG: ABC transporter ATP-binding protein [Stappiaceae bacterium]